MYCNAFQILHKVSVSWKYIITHKKNRKVVLTPSIIESDLKIKMTDFIFQFKRLPGLLQGPGAEELGFPGFSP